MKFPSIYFKAARLIIIFAIFTQLALAQLPLIQKSCTPAGLEGVPGDPCQWNDLIITIQRFIRFLVNISFFVALILVLYGGVLVMLGGPNPGNVSTGNKIIYTALFGYILVLVSGFIIDLVLDIFKPQYKTRF